MDERILKWLYDNISDESVWAIIQKHIPALKNEVVSLIGEG
jgi:uncharacterized protein with HEPN domain